MPSKRSSVSVAIVTYNSARFIGPCLRYVLAQDYREFEVIVIDNASTDDTLERLREFKNCVQIVPRAENIGFAAAQNQAIASSHSDWVLVLNPDVRLMPDFISMAVAAGEPDERVGSVCGKLLRMSPDFQIPSKSILDSTGIYVTPSFRHFDRGSGESDDGRYQQFEYVFGASGAAALYRRRMIDDIAIDGEFFDSDFFAYREDAEVAWRAQLLGWKCLYTPRAVAYHVRSVLPSRRRSVPPLLNMHSVKNRFLMRIKDTNANLYARHFFAITARDCLVIGGCVFREFSSLRAFLLVARSARRTWAKRREIMRRRSVPDDYIARWFAWSPVSYPAPGIAQQIARHHIASR